MKIFITIALMLILGTAAFAQGEPPIPSKTDLDQFCLNVTLKTKAPEKYEDKFTYLFEKRFFQLAGMDLDNETVEAAKPKMQRWWDKYKTKLTCNALGFNVPMGNLLKYAIDRPFMNILYFAGEHELDINFIDPADQKTVLDYVNSEMIRIEMPPFTEKTSHLREVKAVLLSIGAKTSEQIARESNWTAEDYLKSGNTIYRDEKEIVFQRAVDQYSSAIKINPKYVEAYIARGKSYSKTDRPELAVADFTKAIELKPNHIEAYRLRAEVYCGQDKKAEAAADEKKVIELGGKVEKKCQ